MEASSEIEQALSPFMRERLVEAAVEANPNLDATVSVGEVLDLYDALSETPELDKWLEDHADARSDLAAMAYWAAKLLSLGWRRNQMRLARVILTAAERQEQGTVGRTAIYARGAS